ncbi:MAG: DoxX family protein [Thermomicrobiales bacterium]
MMNRAHAILVRHDAFLVRLFARSGGNPRQASLTFLRISMGLVFLGFGVLKFIPGLSPAEGLVEQTVDALTFGLIPGIVGVLLVAAMESTIGLCLITGRFIGIGLALLGMAMIGILSPVALFPNELFAGRFFAPTLEGQYVLKDLILLAAGLVIAVGGLGDTRSANSAAQREVSRRAQ